MNNKAKVFLLIGQSNATGVGHHPYLIQSFTKEKVDEYKNGYPNVFTNYYAHGDVSNGFINIHCDEKYRTGGFDGSFGPEIGMEELLSRAFPSEKVFIIKYAYGGSSLDHDWRSPSSGTTFHPGMKTRDEFGWCYKGCVDLIKRSIPEIKRISGLEPSFEAICWMQGESESTCEEALNRYENNFICLMSDLKKEIGKYASKNICIFDAGISSFFYWTFSKKMNELKLKMAKEHNHIYLDTQARGLTTEYEPIEQPDRPHYDAACTIDLGHLFAEAILKHMNSNYKQDLLTIETNINNLIVGQNTNINLTAKFNEKNIEPKYSIFYTHNGVIEVKDKTIIPLKTGTTNLRICATYNTSIINKVIELKVTE